MSLLSGSFEVEQKQQQQHHCPFFATEALRRALFMQAAAVLIAAGAKFDVPNANGLLDRTSEAPVLLVVVRLTLEQGTV